MCTVTMTFTGQSKTLHFMAGIVSMDTLYSAEKTPLLVGDMVVNFGDILPETNKSSACRVIGGNFHLTWLSIDISIYMPWSVVFKLE